MENFLGECTQCMGRIDVFTLRDPLVVETLLTLLVGEARNRGVEGVWNHLHSARRLVQHRRPLCGGRPRGAAAN